MYGQVYGHGAPRGDMSVHVPTHVSVHMSMHMHACMHAYRRVETDVYSYGIEVMAYIYLYSYGLYSYGIETDVCRCANVSTGPCQAVRP